LAGYAEIARHFRRLIESGGLKPGDRLPPLREVMQEFGVAQQTASRAYAKLRAEGLTTATTGGGTVVTAHESSNIRARVTAYAATGRALGTDETSRIVEVGTVPADETVASRLGVEPGTPVHVRRRIVSRGGVPVHYSSSYYPAYVIEAVPELTEPVSTGASRELAAERLGVPQAQVLEEISPRLATAPEAEALGLTGQVSVNQIVRTVWLADSRTVEVGVKVTAIVLRYATTL